MTTVLIAAITTYFLSWKGLSFFLAERATLKETLLVMPYVLLGILGFLGLRMAQYRILFTSVLMALAYALLTIKNPWARAMHSSRPALLALAIPLSLVILTYLKPGKLLSRFGGYFSAAVLGPLLFEWILAAISPAFLHKVLFVRIVPWPASWGMRIPDIALLLVLGFGGSIVALKDRYFKDFHAAVLLSFLPLFVLLNRTGMTSIQTATGFTGISLALLYGVYHLYWSKVYVDELTGVPNRRALDERLMQLDHGYFIAMADIDHFKKFNDRFGHEEGDNVLRFVAAHMAAETSSRAFRYGGEEFCMVFENLHHHQVVEILDGARASLAAKDFYIRESKRENKSEKDRADIKTDENGRQKVKVTISIGVAAPSAKAGSPDEVIKVADGLLYKAKDQGRNCVVAEK